MEYDTDPLRYDVWIEDALRTVIKRTMSYVSENGLPGEHHFYITFRTTDDKVIMPDYLRADHPEEMTIVLQYQYDSLDVDDDAIYATLRFNGKPETMVIPLSSIVSFADPSVNFGLQLKVANLDDDADDLDPDEAQDLDADQPAEDTKKDGEKTTGEVITLDAFRKK
jgi:uncharacterized protein